MQWKLPPKIKIYEALGAVGDGRIEIDGNAAKVASSSGNKIYSVVYDPSANAIMTNDNGSYWQGYLGYPAIAFLMAKKIINFSQSFAQALAGIPWKDVNTKFKNDFNKTEQYVLDLVASRGGESHHLLEEVESVYRQIASLKLTLLGKKMKPPTGY